MPERVILCIGTKKGLFVAEAAKTAAQLRAARAVRTGRGRLLDADRHARHAAPLRLELQRLLRHEGPALDRPRQEVQGDEVGPRLPEGRRARARQHLVARTGRRQEGPAGAASSRRRSSGAATAAIPGRWLPGISNHEHARKWQPGNGGLCMHTILRDGNRVHLGISTGGHYLSEDGGETFTASNKGVGAGFMPDPYPEFGQCVHKIAGHKDAPGRLYMQNHGGWAEWDGPGGPRPDIGVLRSDDHGQTLALDRQGAAVRLRLPDRRASARPRHGLRHAARADDAHLPGRRARGLAQRERRRLVEAARHAGCRRRRASSPSCATRWTSTSSSRPRSTSGPRPASSGSAATAARSGAACSTRCRRSTA